MPQKVFNITADGDTEEFRLLGDTRIHGSGSFGGGTVALMEKLDGVFVEVAGSSSTEAFDNILEKVENSVYKFNVAGSTAPVLKLMAIGPVA